MIAFEIINNLNELAPVASSIASAAQDQGQQSIWEAANSQIDQGTATVQKLAYLVAAAVFITVWWGKTFKAAIGSAIVSGLAIWLLSFGGFEWIAKAFDGTL